MLQPRNHGPRRSIAHRMKPLPESLFAIYALSLPKGHGFGTHQPVSFWQTSDSRACAVITCDVQNGAYGILVMRRRLDQVWVISGQEHGLTGQSEAMLALEPLMREDVPLLPVPTGTTRRPALHDVKGRDTSDLFKLLARPSHHLAAWLLNQVYLALPTPDANWALTSRPSTFTLACGSCTCSHVSGSKVCW